MRGESEDEEWMNREITEEEVREALGRMPGGKATGEDGIPIECIKAVYCGAGRSITNVINKIWEEGKIPEGWEVARIIPLHKGGEEERTENYRGISLLNAGYKLLTNIMATRLNNWIEQNGKLKESQAGFRRGRGTRDHIFVLNTLINNRLKEKRGKLYVRRS